MCIGCCSPSKPSALYRSCHGTSLPRSLTGWNGSPEIRMLRITMSPSFRTVLAIGCVPVIGVSFMKFGTTS